jgi:hypothetical protein
MILSINFLIVYDIVKIVKKFYKISKFIPDGKKFAMPKR